MLPQFTPSEISRFWSHIVIDEPGLCPDLGPCWVRRLPTTTYWEFYLGKDIEGKKHNIRASRYSWLLFFGEIDGGLLVCHYCDNPPCVRPDHLFLGTDQDNATDKKLKGRMRPATGAQNGRSLVTLPIVLEIRNRYVPQKVTLKSLGQEYGIDLRTVWRIVRGETWR